MTGEHSPHPVLDLPDIIEKKSPDLSRPGATPALEDGNSATTHHSSVESDSSLHSLVSGGQEEKGKEKPGSPVVSSEVQIESSSALSEVKSSSSNGGKTVAEEEDVKTNPSVLPLEESSGASGNSTSTAGDLVKVRSEESPILFSKLSPSTEESSSLQEIPPLPSKIEEEKSILVSAAETEEIPSENLEGIHAAKVGELSGDREPSTSASIEEDTGVSLQAVHIGEEGTTSAEHNPEVAAEDDPATIENPDLLSPLPPVKKSTFKSFPSRRLGDDELKTKVVIPHYLSKGFIDAIESSGSAYNEGPRVNLPAPENPLLVFINSKSGGHLGSELEAFLVDLIAPAQVFDLSKRKPGDVLRYGLGFLEKEADAGDNCALETRNNLRIMVAGGDGTVGWVLGCIAELQLSENFNVPPVGVIPLGTGNDLSRSFRWGGSTTSVSRRLVKRWLIKAIEADVATLDSWEVVVKPAPTIPDAKLTLPHAMHPQHHIPLEGVDSSKEEVKGSPFFEGSFWNYFSLGMDAQVAYGFHHLRDEAPWIASGRVANQIVYGGYGCVQGWFCTPCATPPVHRGIRQIAKLQIRRDHHTGEWQNLELPANIRAIVILNLQSYAGGRNPWGRPSSKRREKEGYVEAKCDDGILEIMGLRDGWHTAFVLLDWFTAVRLGQAKGVRLELSGKAHRNEAYMQMDGEPWQQPLAEEDDPPAVVEINYIPKHSICLSRK